MSTSQDASSPAPWLRMTTAPLSLPAGMRDMLPPRAAHRRSLGRAVLQAFARFGYDLVGLPAFEREEVVARGLSARATQGLVRLLDPDSGEVMVLRPDMTPQIARVAATRFRSHDGPMRLSYEGSVVRRPKGRAKRHRQIAQAGIECLGWASTDADIEVIAAVTEALTAAGQRSFRIELSHARIVGSLLREVPEGVRDEVADAMAVRDRAGLRTILAGHRALAARIEAVDDLAGGADVMTAARALLGANDPALTEIEQVIEGLGELGLSDRLLIDLGELRGLGYYTGVQFQVLCESVGEPLAAGGRYDELLGRYGDPRAATGCAIDLEALEEALGETVVGEPVAERVLVTGTRQARRTTARALRDAGTVVVERDLTDETAARQWADAQGGFARVIVCR